MILIIGYGNSLRQDDGAGLILAQQLEQLCHTLNRPVERISVQQLVPELALDIAAAEVQAVIFADTHAVTGPTPEPQIQITPLSAANVSPSVGHHLSPEVLLLYADRLFGKQLSAWLVTVPGIAFDHGETISRFTQTALASAHDPILNLLTAQIPGF